MDIKKLRQGFQGIVYETPNLANYLSSFPGEYGDVPAVFYNTAPQEAHTPFIVWHIIDSPLKYDSCGEQSMHRSLLQIDFHASTSEEVDDVFSKVTQHVSFLSGVFGEINVGAVFIDDSGDEEPEDVETERNTKNPFRRLDVRVHWQEI